jgi:hypothetical protein
VHSIYRISAPVIVKFDNFDNTHTQRGDTVNLTFVFRKEMG